MPLSIIFDHSSAALIADPDIPTAY